jgi:GT2 family glycosyltransferase
MDKVVAVVLHYENEVMTEQCVDSIKKTAPSVNILVVDNFSPTEYKREDVNVIRNDNNMSVSGMNLGFFYALYNMDADFVVNVDSDIICLDGWLEPGLKAMHEHPEVGIVGGRQWTADMKTHRSVGQDLIGGHLFGDAPNTEESVMWIQGSFVMMRGDMMRRIGLHDSRFQIICSDSDYCLHAWDRGYAVLFVPDFQVIHLGSASYGKEAVETWREDNEKLIGKWFGITAMHRLKDFPYDINSERRISVKYDLGRD